MRKCEACGEPKIEDEAPAYKKQCLACYRASNPKPAVLKKAPASAPGEKAPRPPRRRMATQPSPKPPVN